MMKSWIRIGAALCWLASANAHAHFIWVDVKPAEDQKAQAQVFFGEAAEPGEKHLIGKIAHTKAWLRDAGGKLAEVKLNAPAEDKDAVAALTGDCPAAGSTKYTRKKN